MANLPSSPAAPRQRIVVLLLIAVLAVGCGGGGTKTAGGTPTTSAAATSVPTVTSTTPATATTDPALAAKATAAVLQTADFPYGYQPQPDDPVQGLHVETVWNDLDTCLGLGSPPVQALATSPTFKLGLATQAVATVEYTTPPSADAIAAALAGPKFQGCAVTAFNANATRSAPQGAVPSPAVVTALSVPPVGQKMFANRINVTLDMSGLKINVFQDYYVILNGGTVIRLWFLNAGTAFPPDLEQSLVQKVVTRAG